MYRALRPFGLFLAAFVAWVVLSSGQQALAQDADALLERLRTTYASIDAIQANFTQTLSSAYASGEESASGTITFKDDRYRIELPGQTIVTDGMTTWVFDANSNQVLINDYVQDESTFSMNDFLFNFESQYTVVRVGEASQDGQMHHQLTLAPKNAASMFSEVTVWMQDRDNLVTRLEVVDVNDTKMVFQLDQIVLNPSVDGATFQFSPPNSAEVIDLRS